jgi:hypothetical protein
MDHAIVIPEKGKLKETARALLALADDPRHVMTEGNGTEFRVPQYLADKYAKTAYEPAPTPKRRGRPPKIKNEVNDNGDDLF